MRRRHGVVEVVETWEPWSWFSVVSRSYQVPTLDTAASTAASTSFTAGLIPQGPVRQSPGRVHFAQNSID